MGQVPRPEIRILLAKLREDDSRFLKDATSIIVAGGRIAFFTSGQKRSFLGINPDVLPSELQGDHISVLHNLSLNLPRLSYDSNQDETYFRAKLAMLIGVASDALTTRRRVLERVMKKGLLPTLTFGSEAVSSDAMPLIMNLVGLDETLSNLTKDPSLAVKASLAEKILQTASRVAVREKSGKNERLGIAVIEEEGAVSAGVARFREVRQGRAPGHGTPGVFPFPPAVSRGLPGAGEGRNTSRSSQTV